MRRVDEQPMDSCDFQQLLRKPVSTNTNAIFDMTSLQSGESIVDPEILKI